MGARGALEAVLFDAAGTLIEPREPVGEIYARLARSHGVALPPERLQDAFARVLRSTAPSVEADPAREREWWRGIVRATFRAADGRARFRDFDAYFDALFERFAAPDAWRVRPGGRPALAALRARGLRLAVLSNFDQRLPGLLAGLGLAAEFEAVVIPAVAGAAKPDPRIFAFALRQLGVSAERAVYVGDDAEQDVRAARAAGLWAIDVGSLDSLAELPARVDALAARA
ncbi:MAG: HAD-IA family hydrolase [Deltaproteobacteria bacterium]|nr:MAG: HAD-IA family hydrolase [Deltaproteobacteria bacterium]